MPLIEINIWSDPVWPTDHALAALDLPETVDGMEVATYRIDMRLVAVEVFTKLDEADGGDPGDVETLTWHPIGI